MAGTPNFAVTPHTESCVVTAAVSGLATDAPTGQVAIFTAATPTNVVRITALPRVTTTAGTPAFLLISKSATPAIIRLKDSVTIPAQTISTTSGITKTYFGDYSEQTPLRMGAGDTLYGAIGAAANIVFHVETADF
jgi:hypothetical protein